VPAGLGLVFGAAVGVILFALFDRPVWIGLSAGLGLLIGAALGGGRR
jgi:hypothetical protein